MSALTQQQRFQLPKSNFGDPAARLYPVLDQSDVDAASHLIGKAKDPAAVKKRIIAIARRKGLKIPDAWAADMASGKAAVSMALKTATRGR